MTSPVRQRAKHKRPTPGRLVLVALFAILLGVGAIVYLTPEPPPAVTPPATLPGQPGPALPPASPPAEAPEPLTKVATPAPPAAPEPTTEEQAADQCRRLTETWTDLFSYLDSQAYISNYELDAKGTRAALQAIAAKLVSRPPAVLAETDSILTIMENTAHFYRILGARDFALLKDILEQEAPRMEHDMRLVYQWISLDSCAGRSRIELPLPLPAVYEYAGFFLTTLGGQAYIFRRRPTINFLARYYSILVIDLANEKVINKYGIDPREVIALLLQELKGDNSLEYEEEYRSTLNRLEEKYRQLYAPDGGDSRRVSAGSASN